MCVYIYIYITAFGSLRLSAQRPTFRGALRVIIQIILIIISIIIMRNNISTNTNSSSPGGPQVSGHETGKRKRVTRKADGKLTLLASLGWSWHEKLTLRFSLPILAYPFQGH